MSSGDIHLIDADLKLESSSNVNIIASFSCDAEITRTAFCRFCATLFAATSSGLYGWTTCKPDYEEWYLLSNSYTCSHSLQ